MPEEQTTAKAAMMPLVKEELDKLIQASISATTLPAKLTAQSALLICTAALKAQKEFLLGLLKAAEVQAKAAEATASGAARIYTATVKAAQATTGEAGEIYIATLMAQIEFLQDMLNAAEDRVADSEATTEAGGATEG